MIKKKTFLVQIFLQPDTALAAGWLFVMIIFALFGQFIAGDRSSDGLLPFRPEKLHPSAALLPPLSVLEGHGGTFYLGSDHLGRDLLAGIVAGARNSMLVSATAMVIASLLGILLGGLAGFFGNRELAISRAAFLAGVVHVLLVWFYIIYVPRFGWDALPDMSAWDASLFIGEKILLYGCLFIITYAIFVLLRYVPYLQKKRYLPLDTWTTSFTEVFASIPRLFLILSLVAVLEPGVGIFVLLMSITSWVSAARLVRGEMLRIRRQDFVEAAYALGLKRSMIWLRHALPNSAAVILVDFTFGVAAILMAESTLSFLGVGLPPGVMSWGKLLSNIKYDATAWWLVVFPGLTIFLTVLSIHTLGDAARQKISRRENT